MFATLVTTTPKISMQPLAFQGIMVYASFPQIRDMLLRKFGDDYVLLFARPEENLANGNIDWYSPVQGEAKKLYDMSQEEREPICDSLTKMANEIRAYAEELVQSGEPLKITRGNILKLALRYPDNSALYVIGKQPVLTCWGFAPGTPGVEGRDLVRLANSRPMSAPMPSPGGEAPPPLKNETPPAVAPAAGRSLSGCLWWLLPLLPLLLIFLLLFVSFGSIPALSGKSLFNVPGLPGMEKDRDGQRKIAELEREIVILQGRVEDHAALCQPAKPEATARAKPEPVIPPSHAPEKKDELVIPEKAENTEFLEGSWVCDTGLANTRTGEAVEVVFMFDKNGRGKGIVYERNDQCEGNATSEMRDGVLHVYLDKLQCGSGQAYLSLEIECDNAENGKTSCRGTNFDNSKWKATFFKAR